jgi:hypothetical protein
VFPESILLKMILDIMDYINNQYNNRDRVKGLGDRV